MLPHEVTESYIVGLREQGQYLENANKKISLPEQSDYVARILESPDDLLMGLFVEGKLVGTSGIQTFGEPCQEGISSDASYATMGVLYSIRAIAARGMTRQDNDIGRSIFAELHFKDEHLSSSDGGAEYPVVSNILVMRIPKV